MPYRFAFAAIAAVSALALAACQTTKPDGGAADANTGPETVRYVSANIDFMRDAFAGRLDADPVTLSGKLWLPEGEGPFPVVVWQHGSSAANSRSTWQWRNDLRAALAAEGIGLFIADSYSARGIRGTAKDQSKLSGASRVTDALRAMEALSRHPRVAPARIGLAGQSWGGMVTIRASHEPYAAAVLPGGLRFAAHVSFYPSCATQFERYESTGAPVLVLLGGADDYTPPGPCEEDTERMRQAGGKVETVVYPGAHHGFNSSRAVKWSNNWRFGECGRRIARTDGEYEAPKVGITSEGRTYAETIRALVKTGCAKRGVHVGRDDAAAKDSLARTVAFFRSHL